jgi:hypothetical protein
MGRSERHDYFERLVALRDGYAASRDDREAVLSMADAVRYAEAIMTAAELDVEPWLAEPDEAFADEPAPTAATADITDTAATADAAVAVEGPDAVDRPTRAPSWEASDRPMPWRRFASDLWPRPTRRSLRVDRPAEPDRD